MAVHKQLIAQTCVDFTNHLIADLNFTRHESQW